MLENKLSEGIVISVTSLKSVFHIRNNIGPFGIQKTVHRDEFL
jgi:hypothetical protein